jgi:hypothetical protein
MGYANIVFVYDDAIQAAKSPEEERKRYEAEVGAAIIRVCLSPDFEPTPDGMKRIVDARVFNCSNGVNWVDEVHSSETQVYAWKGNCLRPITELDHDELNEIKDIVDHQHRRMSAGS